MPVDWSRYPANWREISKARREQAGQRCEWCAAPNGAWIRRYSGTDRYDVLDGGDSEPGLETFYAAENGEHVVKVVLTVAHLGTPHADGTPGDKHDKHDVRPENLAALCQRCHLLYDLDDHVRNAAETRRKKRVAAGQTEMSLT